MGTEQIIFEGLFYFQSKHEDGQHLKKVNVALNKITVPVNDQERYCISIRGRRFGSKSYVFSASELCFVEKEEVELNGQHRWSLLDCYKRNSLLLTKTFSVLYLVIKQHDRPDSVTLKLLQDSNFSRQSDNGLFQLYKEIIKTIGSVRGHVIKFRISGGNTIRDKLQRLWNLSGSFKSKSSGSYKSNNNFEQHDHEAYNASNTPVLRRHVAPRATRGNDQTTSNQLSPPGRNFYINFDDGYAVDFFLDIEQTIPKSYDATLDDYPPLPTPCPQSEASEFVSPNTYPKSSRNSEYEYIKPLPKGVLRSQSYVNLKYHCLQDLKKDRSTENVYSDSDNYYRIYYKNTGWIRYHKPSMRRKIRRRSRLSTEIEDVNFDVLDRHEMWFDQSFQGRDGDERYRRVGKIYSHPQQLPINIHNNDDQYWNSDLCLTIQYIMEDKKPKLTEIFDLSFKQMVGVCVHLSVEQNVGAKDWRYLAEYLELENTFSRETVSAPHLMEHILLLLTTNQ
ncbi:hypothetical protein KUTeg_003638 [Tegillarca granosa]|uniref:Uncharacterized protein n=1 Tax=Tegillarca granosa TaxID=220873 RepID=A0ABQ9FMN9_TEGGR|nr:hypothetical protein KUTeg_003638 [Tegillarca granosa]